MELITKQLLRLLPDAMGIEEYVDDGQEIDWYKLFSMSYIHNIIPMVYESAQKVKSFSKVPPNFLDQWRKKAVNVSFDQLYRTIEFLKLYDKLNKAGIRALVVKGIVCRELYPNPYYRSSGDEDIYIKISDFKQVDAILKASGLICEKSKTGVRLPKQVTTYYNPESGLEIELHIDLFDTASELFGSMNALFEQAFETSISMNVDGISVHTLSYDMHILFLILHSIKHFLAIGFGIRQVCDIVMYINAYGKEIAWSWLWGQITELGYDIYLFNLLDIGSRYLGLDQSKICYPEGWSAEDIHSESLLEDIIKAGIFGKSVPGQVKTSAMTLQAVAQDRKLPGAKESKHVIFKTLLPELEYMGSHYDYCRRHPILLPVAWLHRMIAYALETKTPHRMVGRTGNSFEIGKRRIDLLKEYKIIGRQMDMLVTGKRVGRLE